MRWSKYVNKYEIIIIFLSHLQPWQGVKTSNQLEKYGGTLSIRQDQMMVSNKI